MGVTVVPSGMKDGRARIYRGLKSRATSYHNCDSHMGQVMEGKGSGVSI